MAPVNKAALLPKSKTYPLAIETVDYPTLADNELIVKVAAVAINPIDWYIQTLGSENMPIVQYPFISGWDVAGTVVEVGRDAKGFAPGDRVLTLTVGFVPREGAFQHYVAVKPNLTTKLPDSMAFTDAAVLPLGLAVAAGALYEPEQLGLALPSLTPEPKGETVLIWAGSSSIGCNAVQLAVASGYDVVTTCSPHNFGLLKSLGASVALDYKSPTIAADVAAALKGKKLAGAISVVKGSLGVVCDTVVKLGGTGSKKVVTAVMPGDFKAPEGIAVSFVFGGTIQKTHIAGAVYNDFLTEALRRGTYQAKPDAEVVGKRGLEGVQDGYDALRTGNVSAKKIVVSFE